MKGMEILREDSGRYLLICQCLSRLLQVFVYLSNMSFTSFTHFCTLRRAFAAASPGAHEVGAQMMPVQTQGFTACGVLRTAMKRPYEGTCQARLLASNVM